MTTLDQAQPPAESPYVEGTKVQHAWDSQSLGLAMECPRRYYYAQLRGLRRKKTRTTLSFGQAFHKALEVRELTGSVADAHAAAYKVIAEAGGMDEHRSRTPESLHRSIDAYLARHANEELETLTTNEGKPAVELHFRVPLGRVNDTDISYCGYIDRAVKFQEVPYVLDHKTTGQSISTEKGSATYFGSFTPDNQFTGYCFGAREAFGFPVRGVILDAMQVAKTKTEFARNIIHRTQAQVEEWRISALYTIGLAHHWASHSKDDLRPQHFPMNTRACHSRYGACTFAGICGRDPSVREPFLATDFEVREWNPLETRNVGTLETVAEDDVATD